MNQADLSKLTIDERSSLREALESIERNHLGIAIVQNSKKEIVGVITDPDMRRLFLKGIELSAPTNEYCNRDFHFWDESRPRDGAKLYMRQKRIRHMPILGDAKQLVGMLSLDEDEFLIRDNEVVIMAGGLGKRLRPYTEDCPKPMLLVEDKPILEHIIEDFVAAGFVKFRICLNYLGDMIVGHFGNGSKWGVDISYVREDKRLGTAGALSLLDPVPDNDFIVINGDILSRVNYPRLIEFHKEHRSCSTMAVRQYEYNIPFGVVEIRGNKIANIKEKPKNSYYVNAGIYCISPGVLDSLEGGVYCDMTTLLLRLIEKNETVGAFPVHEDWLDVGRHEDFDQAGEFVRGAG